MSSWPHWRQIASVLTAFGDADAQAHMAASGRALRRVKEIGAPFSIPLRLGGRGRTVERSDGGKLRCTGAMWSDAVVIYPGEALALVNIERQVLPSAPRLPRVWYRPPPPTPSIS